MAKSREQYIAERSDDYDTDLATFSLVDEKTVKRLVDDGDIELPYKDLDKIKDKRWNTKQMSSKLLQGILNGDPVDKIAQSLIGIVSNNEAAAMRNARTMVTGAENRGRLDSYNELDEQGVVQKKKWIATPDDRTRESHLEIDGEEVDIGDKFTNGLDFPGDPSGDPSEVYNCRCTMVDRIVGFRRADGSISYIDAERDSTTHDKQIDEERERRGIENAGSEKSAGRSMSDSLASAYQYHNMRNGLSRVSIEKMDELGVLENSVFAKIDKLSEQTRESFSATLSDLVSEYDTPLDKIRIMTYEEYMGASNSYAFVRHDYSTDEAIMVFNPRKTSDYDDMIVHLQESMENGYIANIDPKRLDEYVVTHEFAHTFLDMQTELKQSKNFVGADYDKIKDVRKEIDAIYSDYISQIQTLDEKRAKYEELYFQGGLIDENLANKAIEFEDKIAEIKIGEYSMTNSDEFFAEAFAHGKLGGRQNAYVDKIMAVINKNFRRE